MNISIWNAKGFSKHLLEVKLFFKTYNIDILYVSETHFTDNTQFEVPDYKKYKNIQASNIIVEHLKGPLTISAI